MIALLCYEYKFRKFPKVLVVIMYQAKLLKADWLRGDRLIRN